MISNFVMIYYVNIIYYFVKNNISIYQYFNILILVNLTINRILLIQYVYDYDE
jgi:hypothetical protein